MALFESPKKRKKRLVNSLKKSQLGIRRSIKRLDVQTRRVEQEVVEAARSGAKARMKASASKVHMLMMLRHQEQRRDDLIDMWVIRADAAQSDTDIARALSGLARHMKVPESGLEDAIIAFGDALSDGDSVEDTYKNALSESEMSASLEDEEGLPSVEDIIRNAEELAGATMDDSSASLRRRTHESAEETKAIRKRIETLTDNKKPK